LSSDVDVQVDGIVYFRKILAIDRNPPIDLVIEAGVVPLIVALLNNYEALHVQIESAWALTNLACGSTDQVQVLLDHKAHTAIIRALYTKSPALREQCLWALGARICAATYNDNIAGNCIEYREYFHRVHSRHSPHSSRGYGAVAANHGHREPVCADARVPDSVVYALCDVDVYESVAHLAPTQCTPLSVEHSQ
jgi:hypothetical protein